MARIVRKNDNQNNKERKTRKSSKSKKKINKQIIKNLKQEQENDEKPILNAKERAKFRQSKPWKLHRIHLKKLQNGLDYITQKPLYKGYNVHHLLSDKSRYKEISDDLQICLNKNTHSILHDLYTWKCKNPQAIERLFEVVEKMYILNNGKDFD